MNKYIRQLKKNAAALLAALLVFGACLPANGEEGLSAAEFVPEAVLTGGTGTAAETSSDAERAEEAAVTGEETPAPDGYEENGNTVSEETSGEEPAEENVSASAAGVTVNTASEAEEGEFAFAGGYLCSNYTASRISRGSLLCAGSGAALTAAENSLPSFYSSETEGYTTGVKNQGSDATCWAFAYTETAETDMLQDGSGTTTETVYSPLGTAYFFYNIPEDPLDLVGKNTENKIKTPLYDLDYTWKNRGGSLLLTARTMSGWYGTFSENEFPYTDEKKDSISKDDYKTGTLKAVQTGAYFIQNSEADRDEIRKAVIKYGSVQVAYHTEARLNSAEFLKTVSETSGEKDFYVFRKYRYDSQGNELSANHCVQIVGWDDSISKEQFTHRENGRTVTPRENGAWLVRNSWGENWPASWSSQKITIAHPGYFWLSYEDATIENTLAATETEPAANYLNNYHYDGSASMKSQSLAKAATVFQAKCDDECITAVNVGFKSANVSYTASVYVYDQKPAAPDEGTAAATVAGSTTAEGFYTLKLSEAVSIQDGQYFSVVITPGKITDFYVEQYDNDSDFSGQLTFIPDISAGQGFYKEGLYDTCWYDGGSSQKADADRFCPRIKAFTAKYAIHYDLDGGTGDNPAGYTGKADLTLREPEKAGYAFTGWTYEGTAVPTKNVTIPAGTTGDLSFTAHWEEAGTVYQVKHCREKLSGSGWDVETESFTGTTGTSVTPAVKSYEGYSSPEAQTGKIAESGTEFLYFYTRKSYEVTLTGGMGISSLSGAGTYKYGDTVTVNAEVNSGYNWNKWTGSYESAEKTFSFTMPAGKVSLTANASYQQSGGGGGSGGSGGGSSGGGGGGGGGGISTGLKTAATATFSKNWFADIYGVWRIRDKTGAIVKSAWLCDDAVTANGSNVWYLLNTDGTMLAAGLVQDNTGNFYSLETTHNGYYGMLRYKNGTYDCSGQQVYLEFNNKHDGSFGAVTNPEGLARLAAIYGVTKFGIGNDSIVCTKSFE